MSTGSCRSASASLRGYIYQACWGIIQWLELPAEMKIRFEGIEDIDTLLLDGQLARLTQIKDLSSRVTEQHRGVRDTLSHFLITYSEEYQEGNQLRFSFLSSATLGRARQGPEFLALWKKRDQLGTVAIAARSYFQQLIGKQGRQDSDLSRAFARVESEDQWLAFVTAVQINLDLPCLDELENEIITRIIARQDCQDLPSESLYHRLQYAVLDASRQKRIQDRIRSAADLRKLIEDLRSRLDRWARTTAQLRRALIEVKQVEEILYDPAGSVAGLPDRLPTPSRILDPAYECLPFIEKGRESALEQLESWCSSDYALSILVIEGVGGAGKTRLLLEWCRRLEATGWLAGFLSNIDGFTEAQLSNIQKGEIPCLIVVDYAEQNRSTEALLGVLAAFPQRCHRLRVALIGRNTWDWWRDILRSMQSNRIKRLRENYAMQLPLRLEPQFQLHENRIDALDFAYRSFCQRLGENPARVDVKSLYAENLLPQTPLYLSVLALAAAYGQPVESFSGSFKEILAHERMWWSRELEMLGATKGIELSSTSEAFEKLLASITSLGGVGNSQTLGLLVKKVGIEFQVDQRKLRRAAERFLRPASSEQNLGGLQPDLLGEQLVLETSASQSSFLKEIFELATRLNSTFQVSVYRRTVLARAPDVR